MNRNNIHRATLSMAIALTTGTNALASGIDIQAGQTVSLSGITADMDPLLPGTVVEDLLQEFVIGDPAGNALVGTLQSRVSVRHDTGQINLYWRIRDLSGPSVQISSIVISGFEGWSVGVEWRIDGSGDIGPSDAIRTADDNSIGYLFAGPALMTPDESKFCLASTEAFDYALTGTARINLLSGESITLATWAPAVPAPGAMGMLGVTALAAARRRR